MRQRTPPLRTYNMSSEEVVRLHLITVLSSAVHNHRFKVSSEQLCICH